jgi:hypothetical protein
MVELQISKKGRPLTTEMYSAPMNVELYFAEVVGYREEVKPAEISGSRAYWPC